MNGLLLLLWARFPKRSTSLSPSCSGVSRPQSMANWAKLKAIKDGDVSKIVGFAGSPGTVEGLARVCRTVKEIGDLQEGEILVATTTSPSWAPAFQKIKAAVTDVGGVMCHAAIVCREYGLPAVVGTGSATSRIKTGQRIKVNGSTGEIDILSISRCGGGSSDGHLQVRASLRGMRPQHGS